MSELVLPISDKRALDPDLVGPKAANLAALTHAGFPTPGGFCVTAEAYRLHLAEIGLADLAAGFLKSDEVTRRKISVEVRLGLYEKPIAPVIADAALAAWHAQRSQSGELGVVRSSALIEDKAGANFAGQFESFLGLSSGEEFITALRACWAALWTTNVRRYMSNAELSPGDTAMGVLVQPLVSSIASGGGLSETADGDMLISATWGLGTAIAQGEVVPDRMIVSPDFEIKEIQAGLKKHSDHCHHGGESRPEAVPEDMIAKPCLDEGQILELARYLPRAAEMMGGPVEIEWAMDSAGFKVLQSRPLHVEQTAVPDEVWNDRPGLRGHPAGVGWGAGRAAVIECECQLSQVAPGDILITKVAGPALSHVLPRVSGVVAELGGSTSHLASLARERGIPMVLGVQDATQHIPDGSQVAVDGIAGIVRWMK